MSISTMEHALLIALSSGGIWNSNPDGVPRRHYANERGRVSVTRTKKKKSFGKNKKK